MQDGEAEAAKDFSPVKELEARLLEATRWIHVTGWGIVRCSRCSRLILPLAGVVLD